MAVANPTSGNVRAKARAERMCAATRQAKPLEELIRFACGPDGTVRPDVAHRLGGRGVWLTASERVVREALKRGVFAKGFKAKGKAKDFKRDAEDSNKAPPAKTPPTLVEDTVKALTEAALAALKEARHAGLVVTGAEASEALGDGHAIALIGASAAMRDELASAGGDLPVFTVFTPAQLGLALGGPVVVHAAVLAGPAGTKFLNRCQCLVRFRTPEGEVSHVAGTDLAGTDAGKTHATKTQKKTLLERVGNLNG
jgi:predicted RNA-binding protein YlxR (DUF448 family)